MNIFSGDVSFSNLVKTALLLFQEKTFLFDFFRVSNRNYCVEFSGGQKIFSRGKNFVDFFVFSSWEKNLG